MIGVVARHHVEKRLKALMGPNVRLQRVEAAGRAGVRVVELTGGEEIIWAQTFETSGYGLDANAALTAMKGWVAVARRVERRFLAGGGRITLNTVLLPTQGPGIA